MKIDKRYLRKYYHYAVIDQLKEEYKKKGYTVSVDEKIPNSNYRADLIARKGDTVIILEVKTGMVNNAAKQQIMEISNIVKSSCPNAKFRLVAVNYPDESAISIENIDELITDYFISNGIPSELDELSSHTTIDEVTDVLINSIEIVPGVTSAIAVPAYAGIPVTHRGIATSFAVVTGHEMSEKSTLRWDKLATGVDTLIFLMGVALMILKL